MSILLLLPFQIVLSVSMVITAIELRRIRQLMIDQDVKQQQVDIQRAITTPLRQKLKIPTASAKKTVINGKVVTNQDELIDITDMPWEEAYKAVLDTTGVEE